MSNDQPSDWRNTSIRPTPRISLGNVDVPKPDEPEEEPSSGRLNAKVELQRLEVKPEHKRSPLPSPSELSEGSAEGVIPIGWPPPRLNLKDEATSSSVLGKVVDQFNDPRRPIEPWEAPLQLIEQARRGRESSVSRQVEAPERESAPRSEFARTEQPERAPIHDFTPPPPPPRSEARPSPALPTMGTSTLAVEMAEDPDNRRPRGSASESKKGPLYLVGALALCGITVGGALLWPSKKPVASASPSTAVAVASPQISPSPQIPAASSSPLAAPSESASPISHALPGHVTSSPVASDTPQPDPSPDDDSTPQASASPEASTPSPAASATPTAPPETPKTFSVKVQIESKAKDCQVFVLGKSDPKLRIQKEAHGSISFENLPKGTYRLKVLSKGYLDYEKQFTLPADQKLAAHLEKVPPPAPVPEVRHSDPPPERPAYQEPPRTYNPPPPRYDPPPPRYDPPPPRYNPPAQRHELPSNM